jgi:hypothetical protein
MVCLIIPTKRAQKITVLGLRIFQVLPSLAHLILRGFDFLSSCSSLRFLLFLSGELFFFCLFLSFLRGEVLLFRFSRLLFGIKKLIRILVTINCLHIEFLSSINYIIKRPIALFAFFTQKKFINCSYL